MLGKTRTFEDNGAHFNAWLALLEQIAERPAPDEAARKNVCAALAEILEGEAASAGLWMVRLAEALSLSLFERFAAAAGLCAECGALPGGYLTLERAMSLFEAYFGPVDRLAVLGSAPLRRMFLPADTPFALTPLRLNASLLLMLCGSAPSRRGCTHKVWEGLSPMFCNQDIAARLDKLLDDAWRGIPAAVCLVGPEGSGKTYQIQQLSQRRGLPLLLIDCDGLPEGTELETLLCDLELELLLSPAAVCMRGYTDQPRLRAVVGRLCGCTNFFCLTAREPLESTPFPAEIHADTIVFPEKTRAARLELWQAVLKREGISGEFSLREAAAQYSLTVGQMEAVVRAIKREASPDGPALRREIARRLAQKTGRWAKLIEPVYTLNELVLPEAELEPLRMLCEQVRAQSTVLDDWGYARRFPYGAGLSALFYGPPGTGKTMAAHAVAHELGTGLLRVEVSAMLDKYIGETEKHIAELFAQARRAGAVLFFDEADALFARRSEVSDSTDRYANAQTACLLQAVEDYDGVALLATNLAANFDSAFKRRIRYMLHFGHPDRAARLQIWRGVFPPRAPLGRDIDFERLAERELTAGCIKNIALTAAFLAARQGAAIGMEQLGTALALELRKEGRLSGGSEAGF